MDEINQEINEETIDKISRHIADEYIKAQQKEYNSRFDPKLPHDKIQCVVCSNSRYVRSAHSLHLKSNKHQKALNHLYDQFKVIVKDNWLRVENHNENI